MDSTSTWTGARDQKRRAVEERATEGSARRRRRAAISAGVVAIVLVASACINGGSWSATPSPVVPVQGVATRLDDVSCVFDDWCLAVGSLASDLPLAQVWNGSSWSVTTAPAPGSDDDNAAIAVACGTTTSCLAKVSSTVPADSFDAVTAWDGTQWQVLTSYQTGPFVDALPFACAPDGSCLVVNNGFGDTVVWDGASATTLPSTVTGRAWDVNAIECFSVDLCVAATGLGLDVWDGATWTEQPGSDSWDTFIGGASSLACSAPDDCLAVGIDASGAAPTTATWDGSSWTEVPLPGGVTSVGSLECVSTAECLLRATGAPTGMLAWLAGTWVEAPAPPTPVAGLSCLPRWCLGVGSAGSPRTPTAATYVWTNT